MRKNIFVNWKKATQDYVAHSPLRRERLKGLKYLKGSDKFEASRGHSQSQYTCSILSMIFELSRHSGVSEVKKSIQLFLSMLIDPNAQIELRSLRSISSRSSRFDQQAFAALPS